jgi:hypothetical protein
MKRGHKGGGIRIEVGHVLGVQPPPQLIRVGDWDHLSGTVFKALVQGLVTRNRSHRGIILTAKGQEKPDHILRVTVLPSIHVDLDPTLDGFLSENTINHRKRSRGPLVNSLHFSEKLTGGA